MTLKNLSDYSNKWKYCNDSGLHNIINDHNISIFMKIFSKCPNIKILDLSETKVTDDSNLIEIANSYPKLEWINFERSEIK